MKKQIGRVIFLMVIAVLMVFFANGMVLAAQEKPIKLFLASFDPEPQFGPVMKGWARDLEKRTKGRIKVDMAWAFSLGRPQDYYEITKKGLCDVGQVVPGFSPGEFPMTDILALPFTTPNAEIGVKTTLEFAKKGYLDKDFKDVKVMLLWTGMADLLFTTKKEVKTLADVKGLKILGFLPPQGARTTLMGGTPINPGNPMKLYPMLSKNVAGGLILNYPMILPFRLNDILKYVIEPGIGTGMSALLMNKQYHQKLPADIQAILGEMMDEHSINFGKLLDERSELSKNLIIKGGGRINQWSPQDLAKLSDMFSDIWTTWIEDMTKKGFPAKQAVDDMYNIMIDLGVESPAIGYKPK